MAEGDDSLDNEDVQLIAQALRDAGWLSPQQIVKGNSLQGHPTEKEVNAKLRLILMSLIEAKIQELPEPKLGYVSKEQALEMFSKALKEVCPGSVTMTQYGPKQYVDIGHGSHVVKYGAHPHPSFTITLEKATPETIEDLVNHLRGTYLPF